MNRFALVSLSVSVLLSASAAVATDVYMTRDKDGNVTFSDQPSQGSETHKVKALPSMPAFVAPAAPETPEPEEEPTISYTSLGIISPVDGTTIPTGAAGNVAINGVLSPGLQQGHRVELLNRGVVVETGSSTHFTLEYMDRGEHQLQLRVVDNKDQVLISSNTVTLYVKRTSVGR
ncbi:DUF4124 domain-containing protein [Bacterioplanoides sp.]|uniref:DUF4124 domain-containing protein n=1 Tax=Bacterioplanoides sp. TaxID=2066072 RepID=UPI003AFF987C